jgi:signal transduction histidine kinase
MSATVNESPRKETRANREQEETAITPTHARTLDAVAPEGRVERALSRVYERLGVRVIYLNCVANTAIAILTFLVGEAATARYLRLSTSEILWSAVVLLVAGPTGAAALLYALRSRFRTGLSWTGPGRNPDRAPRVWNSVVRLPYLMAVNCVVVGSLVTPIAIAVFVAATGRSAYTAVLLSVLQLLAWLASAVLWTFCSELVLRPMLKDIAAHLPYDFAPTTRGWPLGTKALAPLFVVMLFGVIEAGGFIDLVTVGTPRLTLAFAIAIATVAVAGLIYSVINRSVLGPLDEVLLATQRVRNGDVDTPVPVVTADELGRLAHSFNLMLAGLREREALREDLRETAEELRASRARIVAASDAERRRVERNIHDGAQQRLVALSLELRMLEDEASAERAERLREMAAEAGNSLKRALDELRELARGLHPSVLETDGLGPALRQLADRSSIPVTVSAPSDRLPEGVEAAAYFVAAEALANIEKYAQASRAEVVVQRSSNRLQIKVADDGVGGANPAAGSGLTGLTDRVAVLGGSLALDSPKGQGTVVTAKLPLATEQLT